MTSATRLYSATASMHDIPFHRCLSTEFVFQSPTNPFSHIQCTPERIVEFSVSADGIRFYKVEWQETWLAEHHLIQYQNLIQIFWQKQRDDRHDGQLESSVSIENVKSSNVTEYVKSSNVTEYVKSSNVTENVESSHVTNSCNQTSPTRPTPSFSTSSTITKESTKSLDDKQPSHQPRVLPHAHLNGETLITKEKTSSSNLKSENSDSGNTTCQPQDSSIIPNAMSSQQLQDSTVIHNAMASQQLQDSTVIHNAMTSQAQVPTVVIKADHTPDDDILLQKQGVTETHPQGNSSTQEQSQSDESTTKNISNKDDLDKVVSQMKKARTRQVELEGVEIVGIENTSATDEEIKQYLRQLCYFSGKRRPRCPAGTANLPQTCFLCQKVFSNRDNVRDHEVRVHLKNAGKRVCSICQKRFIQNQDLKDHMITHSDNRTFVCKICGLTCKRRGHLIIHMRKHEKECNYRCDVCHQNFKIQTDLKDHCLNEHKNQINNCNVCKQKLLTANSVYMHSMRHSGVREHHCDVCNYSSKSKDQLKQHVTRRHMKSKENTIKCPGGCDREFADIDIRSLRKHIRLEHKDISANFQTDYVCTICSQDFVYKARLDEHMKKHEDGTIKDPSKKVVRKKGDVESMSDETLIKFADRVEKVVNPDTGEARLKCKLCHQRGFKFVTTMEKHLQQHKSKVKCQVNRKQIIEETIPHQGSPTANSLQCRLCMTNFKTHSCLQAHMKKCTSVNKGASKRKATLKAKDMLRREIEMSSSDADTYQPGEESQRKRNIPKRKATLSAREKLRMQIEGLLSDEEKEKICMQIEDLSSDNDFSSIDFFDDQSKIKNVTRSETMSSEEGINSNEIDKVVIEQIHEGSHNISV